MRSSDHPWLRRDTLFASTETGVLVSNATVSFEIQGRGAYELFRTLYPLFDGSLTSRAIQDSVPAAAWRLVNEFMEPLADHGFLRWIPDSDFDVLDTATCERYKDQIAFLAQFDDRPHEAFARFQRASVLALGDSALMESLVDNLRDNGVGTIIHRGSPSSEDLKRAHTGHQLIVIDPSSLRCLDELWPKETPVMVLCTSGERLWALSTCWQQGGLSWEQAARALEGGLHGEAWRASFEAARSGSAVWSSATSSEAVQKLFGALMAYEVFKGLTGSIQAETAAGVVALDCFTGETSIHRVRDLTVDVTTTAHPGSMGELDRDTPGLDQNDSRADEYEGDWRALVDGYTSPAGEFDDLELIQAPVRVSRLRSPFGTIRTASPWTTADARIDAIAKAYALTLRERAEREMARQEEHRKDGADGLGRREWGIGVDTGIAEASRRAVEDLVRRLIQSSQLLGTRAPLAVGGRMGDFIEGVGAGRLAFANFGKHGDFHAAVVWDVRSKGREHVGVDVTPEAAQCRAAIEVLADIQLDFTLTDGFLDPQLCEYGESFFEQPSRPVSLLRLEPPGGPDVELQAVVASVSTPSETSIRSLAVSGADLG